MPSGGESENCTTGRKNFISGYLKVKDKMLSFYKAQSPCLELYLQALKSVRLFNTKTVKLYA